MMNFLTYIPYSEFERVRRIDCAPEKRNDIFADMCRLNVLYMVMRARSGHIGSSFSSLDIVSWIYLNQIKENGIYFSSKGHDAPGLYSVLIGLGRLDFYYLEKLRRIGGLPGHPDIGTPFIECNTGSLGMGISKAKGMAKANRLLKKKSRIYVLVGDGELQEGQFWESLSQAANEKLEEITVIIDHNKIQSDTWISKVNDPGPLEKKLKAFGWHVSRCDGHDAKALSKTFSLLSKVQGKPKIIIADTLKGKGVSFMENGAFGPEERLYRFHSGAPDKGTYQKAWTEIKDRVNERLKQLREKAIKLERSEVVELPPAKNHEKLIPVYSRALVEKGRQNPRLVALDADLALDCGLLPFEENFPERFIECGIAEQDMVSMAGGLALKGFLPIVHSFASFLSARANEQIYNNATEKKKIIYAASLAGLLPGGPGHSHQSVRDISAVGSVPGLTMIQPSNEEEMKLALDWAVDENPSSTYLRITSIACEISFKLPLNHKLKKGIGSVLAEGSEAVIFAYGPVMLSEAFRSAALLKKQSVGLKVVNLPWLNTIDGEWLRKTLGNLRNVFTLDDHYIFGGQGQMIAAEIAVKKIPARVYRLGVRDVPVCGQNAETLKAHGLDAESLAQKILSELHENRG